MEMEVPLREIGSSQPNGRKNKKKTSSYLFGFLWLLLSLASADLAAGGVSKVLSARGGRSTSWSFDMGGVSIALGPQRNVAPGTLFSKFLKARLAGFSQRKPVLRQPPGV